MRLAKLLHVDLNSGGGSERLALTTLEGLREFGYTVDVLTFSIPQWDKIKRTYGFTAIEEGIREVEVLDDITLLLERCLTKKSTSARSYELIINTHGDLLPYYENYNPATDYCKIITYCHYPVLPGLIAQRKYNFFRLTARRKFGHLSSSDSKMDGVARTALRLYNQMISNTIVLTNSYFSRRAIRSLYGDVEPIVVSPPVDVHTFSSVLQKFVRQDRIIVLSRYSPDKNIELALEVAKNLKEMQTNFKMIIVGTLRKGEYKYYYHIQELVNKYDSHRNLLLS